VTKRDKKKCGSEEDFKNNFGFFFIRSTYIDNLVDLADYASPAKPSIKSYTQGVGYADKKRNYFQMKKASIESDDGFLVQNKSKLEFIQLGNVRQDTLNAEQIYMLTYEVVQTADFIVRAYKKIPEALANVGGIFKVFSLTSHAMLLLYSQFTFMQDVTEKLCQRIDRESFSKTKTNVIDTQTIINNNINISEKNSCYSKI
jgi:hypothetical protein